MRSIPALALLAFLAPTLGLAPDARAQVTPKVSFDGGEIGSTATLRFDDWLGNTVAVAAAFGLRGQPIASPWGPFHLDGSAFTVFAGRMPQNRVSFGFPVPNAPGLVGAQLFAQGLSLQNGMTEPAALTVRDRGVEPTIEFRVLVLNFDPIIESRGGRRLHEVGQWYVPSVLLRQYHADIRHTSGGYIAYRIVEVLDLDVWPQKKDGFSYTDQSYLNALQSGQGWHQPDLVDYDKIIADHGLVGRVDRGEVDEVLMYGAPNFGFYESQMAGPNAYWCNSPGMAHVPTTRKFVMMGFNYERGYAEQLHSNGHRAESILRYVYGSWNNSGPPRHNWDRFTRYDKIDPGNAACGNIHFPPNGVADYDYGNGAFVRSTCDDWQNNWPNLTGATRMINASEWGFTHHGSMQWWFDHLPRRPGVNPDGKRNNWWKYVQDFNRYPESR